MASTVADVMVPTLRASGARRVYGIPGNSLNGFTLTRCTGTARSSGSTSGMRRPRDSRPAAEAALTGEVAVCAASLWAGNLHLINGLAIRRPGGKAGQLEDALREALGHDGPALVEVATARHELSLPPRLTYGQINGFTLYGTRPISSGKRGAH